MGQALAIATTPAQITPAWLNQVFKKIGHDVVVGHVTTRSIGTGQSAHSERVSIDYAHWDGVAPKSFPVIVAVALVAPEVTLSTPLLAVPEVVALMVTTPPAAVAL